MDIQKLIDEYATWLRKEITFEKVGEYYEITTPTWTAQMIIYRFM